MATAKLPADATARRLCRRGPRGDGRAGHRTCAHLRPFARRRRRDRASCCRGEALRLADPGRHISRSIPTVRPSMTASERRQPDDRHARAGRGPCGRIARKAPRRRKSTATVIDTMSAIDPAAYGAGRARGVAGRPARPGRGDRRADAGVGRRRRCDHAALRCRWNWQR